MAQGLEGVRVVETGGGVAAQVAGKLLADLGATVVKVEPPGGEPARAEGPFPPGGPHPEANGSFIFLNTNKRSVTLDLAAEAGQAALADLAAGAEVVLHDFPPAAMAAHGIDYARLAARNPALVLVSVTPFGLTGPYRDWAASDLTLTHAGGWGWTIPGGITDRARPPIKPFGQHVLIQAGMQAAMAALGFLRGARRSGVGEHVDFAIHAMVPPYAIRALGVYTHTGRVSDRFTPRTLQPNGFFRCTDGEIYLMGMEEDQWARLVELMGRPAWTEAPEFADKTLRAKHMDALHAHLVPWVEKWSTVELFNAAQQVRFCACPAFRHDQLEADPHLNERGYVVTHTHPAVGTIRMPGPPVKLRRPWWALRRPAPAPGEANGEAAALLSPPPGAAAPPEPPVTGAAPPLPLEGVRVLAFTWVWAGPFCAQQLAHLGAEVIKVESAHRLDFGRRGTCAPPGMAPGPNRDAQFNEWNQGQKSVTLNLGTPEGIALARDLAARSDIVISNFATGVMDRLGLGPDALFALNPGLIIGAISGFGQTGPYRHYMGYGSPVTALSGISALTGYEDDGWPQEVATAYGDPTTGIMVAYAALAALVAREEHGGGQYIDAALWESTAFTGFEGWMNHALGNEAHRPMGSRDPCHAPHNLYRCAGDDAWLAVSVRSEAEWAALARALERPELAADPRFGSPAGRKAHEAELDALLGAWCAGQERWAAARRLQAHGVPAFPSVTMAEVFADPQLAARDFFTRLPHPEVGVQRHTSMPWRLARRPNGVRRPAPLLGEHTDEVLTGVLGLAPERLAALRAADVLT